MATASNRQQQLKYILTRKRYRKTIKGLRQQRVQQLQHRLRLRRRQRQRQREIRNTSGMAPRSLAKATTISTTKEKEKVAKEKAKVRQHKVVTDVDNKDTWHEIAEFQSTISTPTRQRASNRQMQQTTGTNSSGTMTVAL